MASRAMDRRTDTGLVTSEVPRRIDVSASLTRAKRTAGLKELRREAWCMAYSGSVHTLQRIDLCQCMHTP